MIAFQGRPDQGSSSEEPRAYKSGPRQGSTQAPSYAELTNPTLVASAISLDTNVTTSVPLMVRPWLEKWEQRMRQGSVLFVYQSDLSRQMQTTADIPTLNYLLENAHNRSSSNQTAAEYKIKEMKDFKFNLMGVMRNDLMAESNLQKLYNVDVFGRSMIANIFGKLKRSDHVGLAVIAVKSGEMYNNLFYKPDGLTLTSRLTPGIHLQVVGTTNGKVNDAIGANYEVKRHYPLGVVSHAVGRVPTQGQIKLSLRNQNLYMLLPRVEILMF